MDEVTRLKTAFECEQLTAAYCQFIDHGEAVRTTELFTEDGVLDLGHGEWRGRDAIRNAMQHRDAMTQRISRHVCNNFLITSMEPNRVTATTYLTIYRSDIELGETVGHIAGPAVLGEYDDLFVLTDEGWRIAQRVCRTDLRGDT